MNRRARALMRPESIDLHGAERPADAMAAWIAGALWLVVIGVVARLELGELLPAAIAGGLVLALGGRRVLSLGWFPAAAALAVLAGPVIVLAGGPHGRPLTHLDLVVLAVFTITIARTLTGAAGRVPAALRQPSWWVLFAAVAVVLAAAATAHTPALQVRTAVRGLTAFLVGWMTFHRSQRTPRIWTAIAVVAAAMVLGIAGAAAGGMVALRRFAEAADLAWRAPQAILHTLLFVTPVVFGFGLSRPRSGERLGLMSLAIAALLAAELVGLARGGALPGVVMPPLTPGLAAGFTLLGAAVLAALALAVVRPGERASWIGLALGYATLLIGGPPAAALAPSPVLMLGAAAAGAMAGALERDEVRGADAAAPALEVPTAPAPGLAAAPLSVPPEPVLEEVA